MKQELAFFLFELGLKSSVRFQKEFGPGSMFTSYKHFGAPEPLARMDRPFASGYQTHPELSRPFWAPIVHTAATQVLPRVALIAVGALTIKAQTDLADQHGFVPSGSTPGGSFSYGSVLGF